MKHIERLTRLSARMNPVETRICGVNGWAGQHMVAVATPKGSEVGFISMLKGWLQFADDHAYSVDDNERGIGNDYYTGDIWARIGSELRGLLSCDIGNRLDCGTLDGVILGALEAEGFDESGERDE